MRMTITDIEHEQRIDPRFAFGVPDPGAHVRLGPNRNPAVSWRELPQGIGSLVLLCVDGTAPTRPDDVNKEDRMVPADLPRTDFYHWVMVDIPPALDGIAEGACSDGVTARGKRKPPGPAGARQGLNDYTGWFADDPDMAGDYYGYDGPCPPWNDSLPHRYDFVLIATDLERCPVAGAFTGQQVLEAVRGHVLAEVRITGLYSLNPAVG
jgi:Raf kinase inhibitor-like YbhB/YbcL family protein